jgi:hypothetical protein
MGASPAHLLNETLIGLNEAARRLPPGRGRRPVSFSCVFRWITTGIPGPNGQRVRLEAVRLGGRWLTSVEALARWADSLTPNLDSEPGTPPRTPAQRSRASLLAARALEQEGI